MSDEYGNVPLDVAFVHSVGRPTVDQAFVDVASAVTRHLGEGAREDLVVYLDGSFVVFADVEHPARDLFLAGVRPGDPPAAHVLSLYRNSQEWCAPPLAGLASERADPHDLGAARKAAHESAAGDPVQKAVADGGGAQGGAPQQVVAARSHEFDPM